MKILKKIAKHFKNVLWVYFMKKWLLTQPSVDSAFGRSKPSANKASSIPALIVKNMFFLVLQNVSIFLMMSSALSINLISFSNFSFR